MKTGAVWCRIRDRVPEDPYYKPRATLWRPKSMIYPPPLPAAGITLERVRIEKRSALLINPFFGKHVLTPSLGLTSIAAATPPGWKVAYWDENLLQGSPPCEPAPEVVGVTVHLTFADRAYAVADAYRRLGTRVILGGLHDQSCPEEAALHADAIAVGDGVVLVVSPIVLAGLGLAPAPAGPRVCAPVPGRCAVVQAVELALAAADQASAGPRRLAPVPGVDPAASPVLAPASHHRRRKPGTDPCDRSWADCAGWRLNPSAFLRVCI